MDFVQDTESPNNGTLSIRKTDVPLYLRAGDFYKSLSDDDDSEIIQIPADVMKETTSVEDTPDLLHLISSARFWMLREPLPTVIEYVLSENTDQAVADAILPFAADFPYISDLHAIRNQCTKKEPTNLMDHALKLGSVEIVKYLHIERCVPLKESLCTFAATYGRLSCLKYLHEHGVKHTAPALNAAIQYGHLECVKYLHGLGKIQNNATTAMKAACLYNQLDCLVYLHQEGYPWHRQCLQCAASRGHLECLKYAYTHSNTALTALTFNEAAMSGNLCLLQFLHEQQCPYDDEELTIIVATGGYIECLAYLRSIGVQWTSAAFYAAVRQGHIPMLKYLHTHGCPWTDDVMEAAVAHNRIPVIEFLREIGCSWSADTSFTAIYYGNVRLLQYLHTHGCPWSVRCYQLAEERNNADVLQYLRDNTCEGVISFTDYLLSKPSGYNYTPAIIRHPIN